MIIDIEIHINQLEQSVFKTRFYFF